MSIWRFAPYLPPIPEEHRVTLGEGDTPLVRSRRIGPSLGLSDLWFKLESCNPTGSFKDRFSIVAVSDMSARGSRMCLATSSGNTGSALAAACATAGISCYIAVVESAPLTKVRNMQIFGAVVYTIRGFGKDPVMSAAVMNNMKRLCVERNASLQISSYETAPVGMVGCETIAYELAEELGGNIDHVFTQAGAGGMTLAVVRGFQRLLAEGKLARCPRVHCVQPEGNNTIAGPLREGKTLAQEVTCTTTVSGLQVPSIIGGHQVIPACRSVGGMGYPVADESVYNAQTRLAREEGIFAEPAGAASLAGVFSAVQRGEVGSNDRIVCTISGIGFKDERSFNAMVEKATWTKLENVAAMDAFLP